MRLALWGCGNTLNQVIDDVDLTIHSIEYLIDSNTLLSGNEKYGIPIRHYKDIKMGSIDAIIITTVFYKEVLETLTIEIPELSILVFENMDCFLAYEYVNITHKEILKNPLYQILERNQFQYDTDKRLQYLEIYDRYFSKYRNTDVTFMEIGVYQGGSLKLWKDYFGNKCKIIGIDLNPECRKYREEQIEIEIGMQESRFFWNYIKQKYPHIDIVLDDGGHTMKQQILTFTELFPHIDLEGIYMCEDVFTSYWPRWGGGWKNESTFIEFSKKLVDHMNTRFAPAESFWNSAYSSNIKSINFHQGIIAIEKDNVCKKLDNTLLRKSYSERQKINNREI